MSPISLPSRFLRGLDRLLDGRHKISTRCGAPLVSRQSRLPIFVCSRALLASLSLGKAIEPAREQCDRHRSRPERCFLRGRPSCSAPPRLPKEWSSSERSQRRYGTLRGYSVALRTRCTNRSFCERDAIGLRMRPAGRGIFLDLASPRIEAAKITPCIVGVPNDVIRRNGDPPRPAIGMW